MATETLDFIAASSAQETGLFQSDESDEYLTLSGSDIVVSPLPPKYPWKFKRVGFNGAIAGINTGSAIYWLVVDLVTEKPKAVTTNESEATVFTLIPRGTLNLLSLRISVVSLLVGSSALTRNNSAPFISMSPFNEKNKGQIWRIWFSPKPLE